MDSARSEDKEARPDYQEGAHHVGNTSGDFWREELLFFSINDILLHLNVFRVAEPAHNDAKDEAAKAKAADDEATDHADPVL